MTAYTVRLAFGLLAIALVAGFPGQTPIPYAYFLLVVGFTVLGSFTRCAFLPTRASSCTRRRGPSLSKLGIDFPFASACRSSTVQFVGISAFHTQISDPVIGGTYMTVRRPAGAPSHAKPP